VTHKTEITGLHTLRRESIATRARDDGRRDPAGSSDPPSYHARLGLTIATGPVGAAAAMRRSYPAVKGVDPVITTGMVVAGLMQCRGGTRIQENAI
jgi:hypothetical protein